MNKKLSVSDFTIVYALTFVIGMALSAIIGESLSGNARVFILYLIPQLCNIAVTLLYVYFAKREFPLLKKADVIPIHYAFCLMIGVGAFFTAILPNFAFNKLYDLLPNNAGVSLPVMDTAGAYIGAFFIICLFPAIGEELIFRKLFCDSLEAKPYVVILLSGVIFSLSHMNLVQTVYQFAIGCLLAFIYIRTRNITLTIMIHLLNNVLALFLPQITGLAFWDKIPTLLVSFFIGAAFLVAGLLIFDKKVGKQYLKSDILVEKRDKILLSALIGVLFFAWLLTAVLTNLNAAA